MSKKNPKSFAFVLMPFEEEFDDTYQLGIKKACEDCNIYCERVDEQIYQESILDRIYNQINKADYIISDLSKKNVNVFYETGYAHAANKNVILLTNDSENIPFDLKHYPHIIYENITNLKSKLEEKLLWFENQSFNNEIIDYSESLYPIHEGKRLDKTRITFEKSIEKLLEKRRNHVWPSTNLSLPVTLQNKTKKLIDLNSFEFGLVTSHPLINIYLNDGEKEEFSQETTQLDENSTMCLVKLDKKLFPKIWVKLYFRLQIDLSDEITAKELFFKFKEPIPLDFRIYSAAGLNNYEFDIDLVLTDYEMF